MKYMLFSLMNNKKMGESIELERDIFPKHYSDKNITRDEFSIFTQFNFCEMTKTQGFKIHVATTLENYQEILDSVYDYCEDNAITFKYISSILYLKHNLSPEEDRKLSGKFITIYPTSDEDFKVILKDLDEKLPKYDVPYIMTDKRYKDSILFYRYGSFSSENVVISSNGEKYVDERKLGYHLPEGIKEPFPEEQFEIPKIVGLKYKINTAIKYKNSGGIYKGISKEGYPVIIKEARPGIYDVGVSTVDNKRNEADFLREVSSTTLEKYFPKFVDEFYDCGHYFVVESFEKGMKLADFKASELMKNEEVLEKVIENILTFAIDMHKFGYFIGDISSNNILVDADYSIKWIDTEHFSNINSKKDVYFRTSGFYNSKINSLTNEEQDKQQLGYLIMNIFTNSNFFLNIDKTGKSSFSFFNESVKNNKYKRLIYDLIYREDSIEKILQRFNENSFSEYYIEERKYNIKNLEDTFNKYVNSGTYYYSNPDNIEKSQGLYGKEGINLVFNKKIVNFDEMLINKNEKYSEENLEKLITDKIDQKDYSLESGLSNIFLSLSKDSSTYKKLKKELIEVLQRDEFRDLGLLNGELGVIYSLIGDSDLEKKLKDRIDYLIKNYLTSSYSFPIRKGSKIFAPYVRYGTAGLLKVLVKYDKIYNKSYYKTKVIKISKNLLKQNYTQNATYSTGMSGIVDALLDIYEYTKDRFYLIAAKNKIMQINNYILEYEGDYFITSGSFNSLGLDYLGGSAGVISVYNRYSKIKEEYYDN